jgi:hypothetical protein
MSDTKKLTMADVDPTAMRAALEVLRSANAVGDYARMPDQIVALARAAAFAADGPPPLGARPDGEAIGDALSEIGKATDSLFFSPPEGLGVHLRRFGDGLADLCEALSGGRRVPARPAAEPKTVGQLAEGLGNSVFAIETAMESLARRVCGNAEAKEIVDEIGVSIEKAKGLLDELKMHDDADAPVRSGP